MARRRELDGSPAAASRTNQARYVLAVIGTIAAAAIIFWKGRAVYRHLLWSQQPSTSVELMMIFLSVVVIQVAYWTTLTGRPPYRLPASELAASIIQFLSRISFMLAGALFSVVVFVRFEEIDISLLGISLFIAVLFTIFCFSRWLDALGREFTLPDNDSG